MNQDILRDCKKRAAERAVELVRDGQIVGLGTGSTARFAIDAVGRRVREGLNIKAVATSIATEQLAAEAGITVVPLNDVEAIDITIDGADEVDENFDMIKGGGGALTREKLVALASKQRVFVVDSTKLVSTLGQTFKLPVEVLPFGWAYAARLLSELGCASSLRLDGENPFQTDNGNYILDCDCGKIVDAASLERRIKLLPAVVECGLFVGIADKLIIGYPDSVEVRVRPV